MGDADTTCNTVGEYGHNFNTVGYNRVGYSGAPQTDGVRCCGDRPRDAPSPQPEHPPPFLSDETGTVECAAHLGDEPVQERGYKLREMERERERERERKRETKLYSSRVINHDNIS